MRVIPLRLVSRDGWMRDARQGQRLTVSLHSIILRNSRSKTLSSAVEIPPTFAYTLCRLNESQKVFEAMEMDVMTKRWQVSEVIVNRGLRSQIWSM